MSAPAGATGNNSGRLKFSPETIPCSRCLNSLYDTYNSYKDHVIDPLLLSDAALLLKCWTDYRVAIHIAGGNSVDALDRLKKAQMSFHSKRSDKKKMAIPTATTAVAKDSGSSSRRTQSGGPNPPTNMVDRGEGTSVERIALEHANNAVRGSVTNEHSITAPVATTQSSSSSGRADSMRTAAVNETPTSGTGNNSRTPSSFTSVPTHLRIAEQTSHFFAQLYSDDAPLSLLTLALIPCYIYCMDCISAGGRLIVASTH
ncbi:hypothetical protein FQN49_007318 [Arthroderma sp. PD_2]|nr:hypothetical protein FQN49_007318 [Arthroderma sp. PD_2]